MKKVATIALCVILLAVALLPVTGCAPNEPSHQELIAQSFADAADINSESYFGFDLRGNECLFLSELTGTGALAQPYMLEEDGNFCGNFYYFHYADGTYLTDIDLRSERCHLYGIRKGDSIISACAVLEQKGFVLDEDSIGDERSIFSPFAVYSKGYIAVLIYRDSYTDSDTITHIGLSAFDPQYSGVIYN